MAAKTVKVVSWSGKSRRVELFECDPDGLKRPAILCAANEVPCPRAGVTTRWETYGQPSRDHQWWVAPNA